MPLQLFEAVDLWQNEIGTADVILVCANYEFNKKNMGMSQGYGKEALLKFPSFGPDIKTYFDFFRKPIPKLKTNIYGTAVPAQWVVRGQSVIEGTALGLWQVGYKTGDQVQIPLVQFAANRIKTLAAGGQRIAVEYPGTDLYSCDEDALYRCLTSMPENVVFYNYGRAIE